MIYPDQDHNTYMGACSEYLNTEVSMKELHKISDDTLGQGCVNSANFWPKKPPKAAPKM
jgi:hypothetical protein